jgi:putative tricarboxylic transport membrane protein
MAALGLVIGAIPGLTATMAITLLIPFTYGMDPLRGLALLIAVYTGGISGGLISAILLRMPGTPASIATVFDGYPMAQKGMAGYALGLGITASFIGTLIGAICLSFLAPLISKFALSFGSFEYFSLGVLALSLMVSLSSGSIVKGLLSGLIGLLVATVGTDPVEGFPRFTMGFSSLRGGLSLLPVLVGIFAVSQVFREAMNPTKEYLIPKVNYSKFLPNIREIINSWSNYLRSALIGVYIGALPGVGGDVAGLIAYDQAKRGSKESEKFGTGVPDGVIAPETANNAVIGGALIPLLTLGIPGNAATAIMLAGLTIHGLQPGPHLFRKEVVLVYGVFAALFISAILTFLIESIGIRIFVTALKVPKYILLPIILTFCLLGAFALNNRVFDMWVLIVFGVIGYLLEKGGFPLGPLVLGVILEPLIENHLRIGLMISRGSLLPFITRPISLVCLVLAVFSLIYGARKKKV